MSESVSLMLRDDARHIVSFTDDAEALKQDALSSAAMIVKVDSAMTQEMAVDAQKACRRVIKDVEDARKAIKAPVLDFGRAIDEAAKKFVAKVAAEEIRVATLLGDFQQLELAKVRAAEAARLLEVQKAEDERRRNEEALRAEEARKQSDLDARKRELERQANETSDAESRARIAREEAEIERQRALAAAQTHEQMDRIQEEHCNAVAAIPVVAPTRTGGQIVREEWEITVTDVHALYRSHPLCVKLTVLLSEIKQLLDAGVTPKGVTAKKVAKSSVRIGRDPKAIDVGEQVS